jgi:hypothetical protein
MLRRSGAKRFARSALALCTVAAVVLVTLLGGQRYFYCRPMDRIMTPGHCPCAPTPSDEQRHASIRVLNDCFEARVLGRLVSFTMGSDLAIPTATLTAMLPAAHLAPPSNSAVLADADHPIRAGPFSPTAQRAQFMVFLT